MEQAVHFNPHEEIILQLKSCKMISSCGFLFNEKQVMEKDISVKFLSNFLNFAEFAELSNQL